MPPKLLTKATVPHQELVAWLNHLHFPELEAGAASPIFPYATPQQFGAFADGGLHAITADDIAAHPEWLGLTLRQRIIATVNGAISPSGAGNVEVVFTCGDLPGSPKTFDVAVANSDTGAMVATKIVTALLADTDVASRFTITASSHLIDIRRTSAFAHDESLLLTIDNGTAGGLTPTVRNLTLSWGAYRAGDSWDAVALQEMVYYCTGGPSAPHSTANSHLNKPFDIPPGVYILNRQVKWNALVGFRGRGTKFGTKFQWHGSDPYADMMFFDGFAYGDLQGLSFDAQAPCNSLVRIDFSFEYVTLKFQNVTLADLTFNCNHLADYGWIVNHFSSGSGQGDTIIFSNVSEFGSLRAGGSMYGQNVLMVTFLNGDSQSNQIHGIEIFGAQAQFDGKHFENQQPALDMPNCNQSGQHRNNGYDVYAPNPSPPGVSLVNCRSESPKLSWGVARLKNVSSEGSGTFSWAPTSPYRFGHLVGYGAPGGKGRCFVQVAPSPDPPTWNVLTPYRDMAQQTDVYHFDDDSGSTYVVDEHVDHYVQIKFPNCYGSDESSFQIYAKIVANGTGSFTLDPEGSGTIYLGGDVDPPQACGSTTQYRILELLEGGGPQPLSGSEQPDWAAVSDALYWPGGPPSPSEGWTGMSIEEGSDVLTTDWLGSGQFNSSLLGLYALVQGAGSGLGDNQDLLAEVVEIIDVDTLRLASPALRSVVNAPVRMGTVIDDGTCKWMHYEYISIVNATNVTGAMVFYGQIHAPSRCEYKNVYVLGGHVGEARESAYRPQNNGDSAYNIGKIMVNCVPTGGWDYPGDLEVWRLPLAKYTFPAFNKYFSQHGTRLLNTLGVEPRYRGEAIASNTLKVLKAGVEMWPFTLAEIEAAVAQGAPYPEYGAEVVQPGTWWFATDAMPGTSPAEGGGPGAFVVYIGGVLHALGYVSTPLPATRVTTNGDRRVTTTGDVRVTS